MPLHPLEFVLQLPERLAVDERDSSELLHHLAHGRLGYGADVGFPLKTIAVYISYISILAHSGFFVS